MNANLEPLCLPEWRCNNNVRAAKIQAIVSPGELNPFMYRLDVKICEGGEREIRVHADWIIRHKPEVGGYLVHEEKGGYRYATAAVFEAQHSLNIQPVSKRLDFSKFATKDDYDAAKVGQDEMRAAFEKAMNDARFFPRELDFTRAPSPSGRDEYVNAHLQSSWHGWQACAMWQETRQAKSYEWPKCKACSGSLWKCMDCHQAAPSDLHAAITAMQAKKRLDDCGSLRSLQWYCEGFAESRNAAAELVANAAPVLPFDWRTIARKHGYAFPDARMQDFMGDVLSAAQAPVQTAVVVPLNIEKDTGQVYGIIDPDYGRIYTIIRKLAWEEGYAIGLHGSFTRDLDLIAIPWEKGNHNPEKLVRRIEASTAGVRSLPSNPGTKPHGRLVWTLVMTEFGDPRFVDLSIMPIASQQEPAK